MIKTNDLGDDIIGIVLDREGSSHNYQDKQAIVGLQNVMKDIAENSNLKGVVISSAKKSFLVGGDLDELRSINLFEEATQITQIVNNAFTSMEKIKIPFVAAINGLTLGGGLELALACNYRIGTLEENPNLGLPEVTLGLMPGGGGTQRLPRLVGYQNAIPMLIQGKTITNAEALDIGLLDECVPQKNLLQTAKDRILEGRAPNFQPWESKNANDTSRTHIPSKKDLDKLNELAELENRNPEINQSEIFIAKAINEGKNLSIEEAIKVENKYFSKIVPSPVAKNKIRTLFYALNSANNYMYAKKTYPIIKSPKLL